MNHPPDPDPETTAGQPCQADPRKSHQKMTRHDEHSMPTRPTPHTIAARRRWLRDVALRYLLPGVERSLQRQARAFLGALRRREVQA